MNFSPYKISENYVLKKLNYIKDGKLALENYDGKIHQFGNQESSLSAKIKIHNPKFYFDIIRGGSSALAENYIKNGKFLLKQGKNKASGIFDYKDSEIKIIKSNVRNAFIDGKLLGNIVFLPFFGFLYCAIFGKYFNIAKRFSSGYVIVSF